jgi:hypothetical protein
LDEELGDAITAPNNVRTFEHAEENDSDLASISRVHDPGSVEHADSVMTSKSAPRADQADVPLRDLDRNPGLDQGRPRRGRYRHIGSRDQVQPGIAVMRVRGHGESGVEKDDAQADGFAAVRSGDFPIIAHQPSLGIRSLPVMPATSFPTVPGDLDRGIVLARCEYFTKVGLWPLPIAGVDPAAWLDNFTEAEGRHAAYLLNAFLFLGSHVIDRIFVAACAGAARASIGGSDARDLPRAWRSFFDGVIVTPVRGESPAITDSGPLFTRRARGLLAIPKPRVLDHAPALKHVVEHGSDVLFVDDFVGTGSQFIKTFRREADIGGATTSFAGLAEAGIGRYFYAPIVATSLGVERIAAAHPEAQIHPGHLLPARYSALHPDSFIWPDDLRDTAREFIYTASQRAGIPDAPSTVNHWEGFGRLGLVLGFDHGTPDATLPLIWWDNNGWTPLRGRG